MSEKKELRKTVLVTGSSRGIGRAIALRLAHDGYIVTMHGRTATTGAAETLSELLKINPESRCLHFDIADREAAKAALTKDIADHGAYFGVVCNAGLARDGAFPALTGEDWDQVLRTNLDGFYNVLNPLIMPMIRRRSPGRVVTIASVSGLIGNRGQVNYSASKAGIMGATKALAVELASRQITVNCVAPGVIRTDMVADAPMDEILKSVPAQRVGEPEEVASLVAYLMSDSAAYITRQVIAVNGGLC